MTLLGDTTPVRDGAVWNIELPRAWDFMLPSGGVLQTASLRAALAELGDDSLRLISASTIFCTPIQPGRLVSEVAVLRKGGSAAQVRIALRSADAVEPGLETIATFARDREGPDVQGVRFPDVPMPEDCHDIVDSIPANSHGRVAFFKNFECRLAYGPRFWAPGWEAGPARYARWFRYLETPRDGADLHRLAHPPIIDTMPSTLAHALGPSTYRFFAPSLDLTTHVIDDTDRDWLLVSARMRRARAGYATAEVEVWDDRRRFLAYGSQTMYIRNMAGTPPSGVLAPP